MKENIDYALVIKAKLNIVDYIGKDLRLIKSGDNYKALCPFHSEKTPSFIVNSIKESYRCFGCGKSGDIFTYVMEKLGVNFKDALNILADEAGIIIKDLNNYNTSNGLKFAEIKKKYYEIMSLISKFYQDNLKNYLKENTLPFINEKKLNREIIQQYQLGLSTNFSQLESFLLKKKINSDLLLDLKIIKINKLNKKYDVFSNRFMFPIKDRVNRVIGFGGRSLDGNGPKYINSWENDFFKKRNLLYNMNSLKDLKQRDEKLFIVEGYTDVIALEKNGYNAVAPLGTSVSKEQLEIAWNYVNEPIIFFDGDSAGIKAAYRVMDIALPELQPEKTLNFLFLKDNEDPDTLLKTTNGKDKLIDLLNKKYSFLEALLKAEMSVRLDSPERVLSFKNKLFDKVDKISNLEVKKLYKMVISEKLRTTFKESINYTNYFPSKSNKDNQFIKNFKDRKEEEFVLRRERSILGAMINNFNLLKNTDEILAELFISNKDLAFLRDNIIEIISQEKVENSIELKNQLINKGFSNIIKSHFQTKDCIKFNLIENYAKEHTNIIDAKKALMNVINLQENWHKKNKNLRKIT